LGADQQRAFDDIKKSSPSVMKAPMTEILFLLYIIAEDIVIGVVLM
jgi:hypothetical protein